MHKKQLAWLLLLFILNKLGTSANSLGSVHNVFSLLKRPISLWFLIWNAINIQPQQKIQEVNNQRRKAIRNIASNTHAE
jgi:hypothetical protein